MKFFKSLSGSGTRRAKKMVEHAKKNINESKTKHSDDVRAGKDTATSKKNEGRIERNERRLKSLEDLERKVKNQRTMDTAIAVTPAIGTATIVNSNRVTDNSLRER